MFLIILIHASPTIRNTFLCRDEQEENMMIINLYGFLGGTENINFSSIAFSR